MEDKKYAIELEVVTPLSVGAGNDNDWLRGIDFVQKGGNVYVLDIKKVAQQGIDIDRLTTLFENSDEEGISQLIGNKLEEVSKLVFKSPVSTTNAIKTFLRTQFFDKPIVAGSSIKGAVRSALFNYLRDSEKTNEEVFGNMKDGTDFMRFIRFADIEMPATALVNTKIFNLQKGMDGWTGGWKHGMYETTSRYRSNGFNTLYECVAPGKKGIGSIVLSGRAFEVMRTHTTQAISHDSKKKQLLESEIHALFHVINQVTKGYLLKEKAFFEKYQAERSDELVDNVDALLRLIPDDDSYCLLKMSAGVGFHSITGDWRFEDYSQTGYWTEGRHTGKKQYKSRKTVDYNGHLQLMGFVRLRALTVDETSHYSQSLDSEHSVIIDNILTSVRLREAERQKQIEEKRLRQLAIEEEARKQEAIQNLLNQARQMYDESQWEEAIAKVQEVFELSPDNKEAASLLIQCKDAKEIAILRQQEQEAAQQKLHQPLLDLIKLAKAANYLLNKTKAWVETEGNVFGKQEETVFLDIAKRLPNKEKNKLKSKLPELSQIFPSEQADTIRKALEEL